MVAAVLLLAGCGGGSGGKYGTSGTPTPASSDAAARYYHGLGSTLNMAEAALGGTSPDVNSGSATPSGGAIVDALDRLAGQLRALDPPAAARSAYTELLDATNALIAQGRAALTATPINDATAEAQVVPVLGRFTKACTDLARASDAASASIRVGCDADAQPQDATAVR